MTGYVKFDYRHRSDLLASTTNWIALRTLNTTQMLWPATRNPERQDALWLGTPGTIKMTPSAGCERKLRWRALVTEIHVRSEVVIQQ